MFNFSRSGFIGSSAVYIFQDSSMKTFRIGARTSVRAPHKRDKIISMKRQFLFHGWYFVLCITLLLNSCITQPSAEPRPTASGPIVIKLEENPYAPKPEDLSMTRAGVILTSLDLSELPDSTPLRSELTILGSMPSVCNELRIKVNPPDAAYKVHIEVYSIVNPNLNCENVFQQFETSILLGEYSAGQYSIWVNNSFVGEMVSY